MCCQDSFGTPSLGPGSIRPADRFPVPLRIAADVLILPMGQPLGKEEFNHVFEILLLSKRSEPRSLEPSGDLPRSIINSPIGVGSRGSGPRCVEDNTMGTEGFQKQRTSLQGFFPEAVLPDGESSTEADK